MIAGKSKRVVTIVIAMAIVLTLAVGILLSQAAAKRRAQSINCRSYMISIGFAARIWANDHGDVFPDNLASISNELNTTKILFCPSDRAHPRPLMDDWSNFDEARCSYEVVTRGIKDNDGSKIFLRCKAHGHLGYGDGSVFDGVSRSWNK